MVFRVQLPDILAATPKTSNRSNQAHHYGKLNSRYDDRRLANFDFFLYDPVLLPEKSSPNFLESYFFKSLDLSVPLFMHVTLALLTDGQSPGEAQQEQRGWVFPDLHFTFSYRNDMNPVMGAKGQKISQLSPQIVVVEQRATRVSAWGTSDTHHTGRDPGFEPA
ncbi:hypothetical protein TUN199_01573 [Pyrenophora tritici-repentis]|nr:hypothetical protein Alg215_02548 [Pyrenophora tritici-repentis]KAI0626378.1 hypothetical protein TUN199_01573 [Pyrenophora tritici-repentis]KAI1673137.1 hypothetical protein L13192_03996 [Pyrenophora tritici-repentis]